MNYRVERSGGSSAHIWRVRAALLTLLAMLVALVPAVVLGRPAGMLRGHERPAMTRRLRIEIARERARVAGEVARDGLGPKPSRTAPDHHRVRRRAVVLARAAGEGAAGEYIGLITDLGTIGGTASRGGAVDSAGDVVGDIELADGVTRHAAVWPNTCSLCEVDLGSLRDENEYSEPGLGNSLAKAVNPAGTEIAGWSETNDPTDAADDEQSYHAATWTLSQGKYTATDLGTLAGDTGEGCGDYSGGSGTTAVSWATGVNAAGVAVGVADTDIESCPAAGSAPDSIFPFFGHAFRDQHGTMEDLGTLEDDPDEPESECAFSEAEAINAAGAVAGTSGSEALGGFGTFSEGCSGTPNQGELIGHAFLIPAGGEAGDMQDLGNPAGGTGEHNYSEADGINENGDLAVNGTASNGVSHGYLYKNGKFTPVGTLGESTYVYGINDEDALVGVSYINHEENAIAFVAGKLLDLNDLLEPGSPWDLARARSINDHGVITGTGFIEGREETFRMQLVVDRVDILTSPPALTNVHSAAFEFSSPAPGAKFECSLDKAAYTPCTSPASYSNLVDGAHSFSVRAVAAGFPPSEPDSREWTIENQPPQAEVTSSPSGIVASSTAEIVFKSSTAQTGVTFKCSLDGEPEFACASPQKLAGLAPGRHVFKITAINQFGEASSAPTIVEWTVAEGAKGGGLGAPPPPTSACAAPSMAKVSSGLLFMVGRSGTCISKGTLSGEPVWEASGPVTVDGIGIIPGAGTLVALSTSPAAVLETTGPCSLQLGTDTPLAVSFPFTWAQNTGGLLGAYTTAHKDINQSVASWGTGKVPAAPPAAEASLVGSIAGMKVPPVWPQVELSSENGGTAKIALQVTLPNVFSAVPSQSLSTGVATTTSPGSSLYGAGITVGITASNENGVTKNIAGRIDGELWLGPLSVKNLQLAYESVSETVTGALTVGFLGWGGEIELATTIGPEKYPALIGCCVEKLSIAAQKLHWPLYSGVFLDSLEGSFAQETETVAGRQQSYLKIGGGAGVTVGPEIAGLSALELKGKIGYSFSQPWVLELSGKGSVIGFPLANSKYSYTNGVGSKLSGNVEATIGGYGFSASITKAFFQGNEQFNINAEGVENWPLLGRQNATVVFSNKGFAACTEVKGAALGSDFALGWGILLPSHVQQVFTDVCSLGPFEATASRATAAGAGREIKITGRAGPRVIGVSGNGGAPQVTVEGPGGLHLETVAAAQPGGFIVPDSEHDMSYIVLTNAVPGTYSVTSSDVPITAVDLARTLPPVHTAASVKPTSGGRMRLSYHQTTAPGEQLELFEQGGPGNGRLLLTTTRAHGTITFKPADGLGSRRHILAVTLNGGLPRASLILAPFAVDDSPPGRVHSITRHASTLTWKPVARAHEYVVAFVAADGLSSVSTTVTSTRIRIPAASTRVVIVAVDAVGRLGPAANLKLPASKKSGAHKHH
jgi:uncharacterized membrane protein